jgi:hypothetical protein
MCPWKYTSIIFEEMYLPRLITFKGNFPGHKRFQPNGSPLNSTCVSETRLLLKIRLITYFPASTFEMTSFCFSSWTLEEAQSLFCF